MAIPILGIGSRIDNLVSFIGDAIPIRFRVELVRDTNSSRREAEFERIRDTFRKHTPPIAVGERIGSGGFADVFRARSYYNGATEFAIKVLRTDLLKARRGRDLSPETEEMRIKDVKKRFTNESYVQWHLSQNLSESIANSVVRVYDHGEFDRKNGYRFILMEQMGHTLRDFIGEVSHADLELAHLKYKTQLMVNIATTVENVHREGIFHRDIKPENMLFVRTKGDGNTVTFPGSSKRWPMEPGVKLSDFGTVRWVRSYSDKYDAIIIGSQRYMSPEQILDPRHLDLRTDVYSFGVVCYELLFGVHPKRTRTGTRVYLEKIAHAKPERRTPPTGFERLNDIIFKCMEPIEQRYQSMAEVLGDLTSFRDGLH
jgi:eukaryotic-like serine/threonine-protein kinase